MGLELTYPQHVKLNGTIIVFFVLLFRSQRCKRIEVNRENTQLTTISIVSFENTLNFSYTMIVTVRRFIDYSRTILVYVEVFMAKGICMRKLNVNEVGIRIFMITKINHTGTC